VQTTGPAHAIRLSTDRDRIVAAPADVAHVTVEIVDKNGLVVPTAADSVTFALSGPGKIIGVDNGQPDSHEPYQANTRKAFNGLALALVQATGTGAMTLSATAPSLEGARVAITGYRGGGV
jgi:beta-galactosidase